MTIKKKLPQAISAALSMPTLCLGLALVSTGAHATTIWQYLGGTNSYDKSTGQPSSLTDMSTTYPSGLLQMVINRLPEGGVAGYKPVADSLITDDAGANLVLNAPATVKVSYVFEGAGYQNSVGFFKFAKGELTTLASSAVQDTIIFPNFSDNVLQSGKAVNLGSFVANDAIGFTIVSNGWQSSTGVVNPNKSVNNIFRTIKRFNPETTKQGHTVLLSDPAHELLVLAFEDLHRENKALNDNGYLTDDDFNDVVIAIHVSPFSAVDCATCIPLTPTTPPPATPASGCAPALTTTPIPAAAIGSKSTKVNICHLPTASSSSYQKLTIKTSQLSSYSSYTNDTFQLNGVCPPISAGACPTTPTCTSPQVLQNGSCVTPVTCTSPQILQNGACVTPVVTCTSPQVLQNGACVTPVVTCTAPQVLRNGTCVTPIPVVGESGPISWREITAPSDATDSLEASKAAAKTGGGATTPTCTSPQVLQSNGTCQ